MEGRKIIILTIMCLILQCVRTLETKVDEKYDENSIKFAELKQEYENQAGLKLEPDKNPDSLYMYLTFQGRPWVQSLPPSVHVNQKWYHAVDGSLKLLKTRTFEGSDKHGTYIKELNFYTAGGVSFVATLSLYYNKRFLLYGQEFPDGANMTYTGDPMSSTMSAWPVFVRKRLAVDLGYLAYGGIMSGDTQKHIGIWADTKYPITSGIYSGPLTLFDYDLNNTIIISPYDQFTATSTMYNSANLSISYGVMGNASHIPPGFKMETIVFVGSRGINEAYKDWGKLMRYQYARTDKYVKSDFTNNYLGYWMDGGAFYSYHSEPNRTMEQTVLDIRAQSLKQHIPYRYVEFDEWFYCQLKGKPVGWCDQIGTELWIPAPGVFPNGFKHLSDSTRWPVHGSNKWWSNTTPYAKQNGGNYTFVYDDAQKSSLPVDQCFWDYLMNMARQRGQIVYEQDFQSTQFEHLWQLTSNVTLGHTWYSQMGKGAELNGIAIQYCMAPSRAILQALEIPVVTQARASNDYRPGGNNWQIGISSMFLNAVGIRPFKDNFWTTSHQSGYNFGNINETQLELVNMVATMSMGPVGPSDKLNHTDPVGLMRCCNAEGLILQPSYPPTLIDQEIRNAAFSDHHQENQIWSTSSLVSGYFFGIIMALDVKHETFLHPSDTFKHLTDMSRFINMAVFNSKTGLLPMPFGQSSPLKVRTKCRPVSPCVFYTTPKFIINGTAVYLLGELSKWVPVSPKRIQNIRADVDLVVDVTGMPTEEVEFFAVVGHNITSFKCIVPEWGHVSMYMLSKKCQ